MLVTKGRCTAHQQAYDRRRGTARERGFNAAWDRFSEAWRQRYPLCGMRADGQLYAEHSVCVQQGRTQAAQCVDHIDGHSRIDDRETFCDPKRLQSLCLNCNRLKAIQFEGGLGR